jgi:hypothetical protein
MEAPLMATLKVSPEDALTGKSEGHLRVPSWMRPWREFRRAFKRTSWRTFLCWTTTEDTKTLVIWITPFGGHSKNYFG